jgi:uncharacterized protein YkwD
MDAWTQGFFDAHQQQRQQHGLPLLQWSSDLESEAAKHCQSMVSCDAPSHDLVPSNGYQNVLQGKLNFVRKPEKCIEKWLLDDGHRRPILDPSITRIGGTHRVHLENNNVYVCCNYS